jgi:hypothetical protein
LSAVGSVLASVGTGEATADTFILDLYGRETAATTAADRARATIALASITLTGSVLTGAATSGRAVARVAHGLLLIFGSNITLLIGQSLKLSLEGIILVLRKVAPVTLDGSLNFLEGRSRNTTALKSGT